MAKVLIIDDDHALCGMLSRLVGKAGHEVTCRFTLGDGVGQAAAEEYDVIYLDVRLPDGNGLDALSRIRSTSSSPEVIIMTGAGDCDGAEMAIRSGAWDYVEKPSSVQEMTLPLVRALQYRDEKKTKYPAPSVMALKREGIIGDSPRMAACFDLLARVAGTEANVLIAGETGTGKELFALAVHKNSPRCDKPFVVVDCSALPETLVESMLFGHERGAFKGAGTARQGLIKQADGGTLFLDEVGELPLNVQKAFLRVLQERRFRPIGGKTEIESDFRLVAATNRNLHQMVQAGDFREDLLFRLNSFIIELPPLRDRDGDLRELALHHVAKTCERYKIGLKGFAHGFLDGLAEYRWSGNVRELFHTLESAVAAARYEPTLFPKHLPDKIRICLAQTSLQRYRSQEGKRGAASGEEEFPTLKAHRDAVDKAYLRDLMARSDGNIKEACVLSGVSRSRLYELLKLHDVPVPTQRQGS